MGGGPLGHKASGLTLARPVWRWDFRITSPSDTCWSVDAWQRRSGIDNQAATALACHAWQRSSSAQRIFVVRWRPRTGRRRMAIRGGSTWSAVSALGIRADTISAPQPYSTHPHPPPRPGMGREGDQFGSAEVDGGGNCMGGWRWIWRWE